jgi:hypothetical protein
MREALASLAVAAGDALAALGTGDRAAVMCFGSRNAVTQEWTTDFGAAAEGVRRAFAVRVGLDTDINQAVWAAADYVRRTGGTARRAILILTDNMQQTRVPDALVEEQLFEGDAVLDGLLVRGRIALPHLTHSGVFHFAAATGGEVMESAQAADRLGETIARIKARYTLHFRAAELGPDRARRIHVELSAEGRRKYPNAVVRARGSYFPRPILRPWREIPGKIAAIEERVAGAASFEREPGLLLPSLFVHAEHKEPDDQP